MIGIKISVPEQGVIFTMCGPRFSMHQVSQCGVLSLQIVGYLHELVEFIQYLLGLVIRHEVLVQDSNIAEMENVTSFLIKHDPK